MPLLNPGDHFPPITITPVDGEAIDLPDALAGHFAVILFNRGSWCPYCNAQLRAFQRHAEKLDALDIKVVSLSVDDEATARELIAKHGLTFPVGHSADAVAIHEETGAFVNADPLHLQSTGFVLDPDGHVVVSVYSSGAIGRLLPEDVVGLVKYLKSVQPRMTTPRRQIVELDATVAKHPPGRGRASGDADIGAGESLGHPIAGP